MRQTREGNKELLKLKQKQIQVALRGGLDTNTDAPKSEGYRNSSNGNISKRFLRGTKNQHRF